MHKQKPQATSRMASGSVAIFMRDATPGQRLWFLTRGEPQCLTGNYLDEKKGFVTRLYPGLRGIRIGAEVKTVEEGLAKAAETKANMLAEGPLEAVDEQALGIDDEAIVLADRFQEVGARIEQIIHIGSMCDSNGSEPLVEAIEDIVSDIHHERERKRPAAPLLEGVDPEAAAREVRIPEVAQDLPLLLKLADMEARTKRDELFEEFIMLAHDYGAMGFLVQVSVPKYVPHSDGQGASIHGGTRYLAWRYASTYQVAADRALEWGATRIAEMWPQRKAA